MPHSSCFFFWYHCTLTFPYESVMHVLRTQDSKTFNNGFHNCINNTLDEHMYYRNFTLSLTPVSSGAHVKKYPTHLTSSHYSQPSELHIASPSFAPRPPLPAKPTHDKTLTQPFPTAHVLPPRSNAIFPTHLPHYNAPHYTKYTAAQHSTEHSPLTSPNPHASRLTSTEKPPHGKKSGN